MNDREKFYKEFKNQVVEEIRYFFYFEFDIELDDSPQILKEYLYLEFWTRGRQFKIRIKYDEDMENFLYLDQYSREYIIMKAVMTELLKN